MSFRDDADAMTLALAQTPNWARVRGDLDDAALRDILTEAAKCAETVVAPLDAAADRIGARVVDGHVVLPPGYHAAYGAMAQAGWIGLEHPEARGGMGLPLTLFAAVDPLFERASVAFMMAAGGSRAAALLLEEWADEALKADWVPALIAGERCATICISEPGAGSDLGRIRTRATQGPDGGWQVSGQKIWISFGDHDLRERIGHCLLARTGEGIGTRGLSLFFVERGAGVSLERIEEKLGLHGSPTCALHFDKAPARLIGAEGRGLAQLFTMIRHMRLSVGCQGLGLALRALDCARDHAATRRQGGNPAAPPVPIITHPDVARQLRRMQMQVDLFRLALLELATASDLAAADPALGQFAQWLAPLCKNFGAELGFETAAQAVLVLGGVGVTRDYPVEQVLRDARVFAVYEGTTGMQGQDFLLRQSLADGCAKPALFFARAAEDLAAHPDALAVVNDFRTLLEEVAAVGDRDLLALVCDDMMRAGWIAVQAWLAPRLGAHPSAREFMLTARARLAVHAAAVRGYLTA